MYDNDFDAHEPYEDDLEEFERNQVFADHEGEYDEEGDDDFADPGGNSALRAATPDNPRNLPCPTCGKPDRLTPKDVALGYQCNPCADRDERGW